MLARTLPSPGVLDPASDVPRCGLADLDSAGVLRPGAVTLVDLYAGADALYGWMADAAVAGRQVLVADGGNFLDAYRLATAARRRAADRLHPSSPGAVGAPVAASRRDLVAHEEMALERVRLARGFTAYQLHSIIEGLEAEAEAEAEAGRVVGLVVVPGLLDMYLDDELSREESRALVGRALSTLRRLAARVRVPVVVANWILAPTSDHPLRVLLDESVDEHVIIRATNADKRRAAGRGKSGPRGATSILLPRRGAMFLSPGAGLTRLEDHLEPEERSTPVAPIPARKPGAWRSNGNRMYGKFGEVHRRADWAVHEARARTEIA